MEIQMLLTIILTVFITISIIGFCLRIADKESDSILSWVMGVIAGVSLTIIFTQAWPYAMLWLIL